MECSGDWLSGLCVDADLGVSVSRQGGFEVGRGDGILGGAGGWGMALEAVCVIKRSISPISNDPYRIAHKNAHALGRGQLSCLLVKTYRTNLFKQIVQNRQGFVDQVVFFADEKKAQILGSWAKFLSPLGDGTRQERLDHRDV